jgi:hypothetical protein
MLLLVKFMTANKVMVTYAVITNKGDDMGALDGMGKRASEEVDKYNQKQETKQAVKKGAEEASA